MNQITMLALTLMVGVVVDDAIIVLENIYRYMEEKGMGAFEAAERGTKEIGLAVLATTVSLLAVFIPVGFMGGISGRLYQQFAITSAISDSRRPSPFSHSGRNGSWMPLPRNRNALKAESLRLKMRDDISMC